ncbi:hypothetical protein [Nocardiopsis sp. NPDC058789]
MEDAGYGEDRPLWREIVLISLVSGAASGAGQAILTAIIQLF